MVWCGDILLTRFSDSLSAGFPSPAEGYEDEPLNLHSYIVRNPAATFFYRVQGDVLRDEHIRDGSILVCDRSVLPQIGRLIVAEHAGGFVVIRWKDQHVIICGVVIACVTRF